MLHRVRTDEAEEHMETLRLGRKRMILILKTKIKYPQLEWYVRVNCPNLPAIKTTEVKEIEKLMMLLMTFLVKSKS